MHAFQFEMEIKANDSSSLMRQTLLEALLSVQMLRANVQQSVRALQSEGVPGTPASAGVLPPSITTDPHAADSDTPGPPSPTLQHQRQHHLYPEDHPEEQAFSNVLFQNVLFQDAWPGHEDGSGQSDQEARHDDDMHGNDQHGDGHIDNGSPVLAHIYSPATATASNQVTPTSATTPPKATYRQLPASSSAALPVGRSTPLRAALEKLNDRGENGVISAAYGFDSPPQAEREFQRSARSSMDAAAFFKASRWDAGFNRRSFNGTSSTKSSSKNPGTHDPASSHRPSARKNLATTLSSHDA
uniref:Uncharacterized protein n=1 Tax=Dunaliella tertiolecta TaxID=3047 RepID=A0A7S3QUK9_DUNTE|mmetsp:Transcript_18518/g.48291  ORF Transcript_18518/g.48291 Transcript_18518/m.48291 type:complete len:300 (-) Transcript_18518:670-1569(-)